jgi:aminopeptidase
MNDATTGYREACADLILRGALGILEGQILWIRTEPFHRPFAGMLAKRAYELGARYVQLLLEDPVLERLRVDCSVKAEFLEYVPEYTVNMLDTVVRENWRTLSLRGPENPDLMEGADPGALGRMQKARSEASQGFMKAISSNRIPWNVFLMPTPDWAAKVLGSPENWEEEIWKVLAPILRLDTADPVEAWNAHDLRLKKRASFMNENRFDGIRFRGPGTDLFIGMESNRLFLGGSGEAQDGTRFFPNIPTEEIFSTPHMNRTEGRVACTRPVTVLGAQVEDAWFVFKGGVALEFGAGKNGAILEKFMDTDQGASRLGEVALVGIDSPLYRSGRVFHNILLDENASCHIALGNGYTDCIQNGTEMDENGLSDTGCNVSLVHTDFMIGSSEVSVFGVTESGEEIPVMENGLFVI